MFYGYSPISGCFFSAADFPNPAKGAILYKNNGEEAL